MKMNLILILERGSVTMLHYLNIGRPQKPFKSSMQKGTDNSPGLVSPIPGPVPNQNLTPSSGILLAHGEMLGSSGKFDRPTKIAEKNYFKDEIMIRNCDSGKGKTGIIQILKGSINLHIVLIGLRILLIMEIIMADTVLPSRSTNNYSEKPTDKREEKKSTNGYDSNVADLQYYRRPITPELPPPDVHIDYKYSRSPLPVSMPANDSKFGDLRELSEQKKVHEDECSVSDDILGLFSALPTVSFLQLVNFKWKSVYCCQTLTICMQYMPVLLGSHSVEIESFLMKHVDSLSNDVIEAISDCCAALLVCHANFRKPKPLFMDVWREFYLKTLNTMHGLLNDILLFDGDLGR